MLTNKSLSSKINLLNEKSVMKINSIEIENFRSIRKIKLNLNNKFKQECRILLGINESGKSNILKAIALLDRSHFDEIDYSLDCNKKGEKDGESISVMYSLEIEAPKAFKEKLIKKGYPKNLVEKVEIEDLYRVLIVDSKNEHHDSIEFVLKENKCFNEYFILNDEIKKISDVYSGEEELTKENIAGHVGEGAKLLTRVQLEVLIEKDFSANIKSWTPQIIFWEYDEKYLLNKPIDLNAFAADENTSIPLRNIFHIANIKNITERIQMIANSMEKRRQLEEELTTSITNYINHAWQEHEINVKVCIENMQCSVMIEDKDNTAPKYNINQRSDGFKQFISILLNFSAENAAELLKNSLILLDEPEVHLHPSGIRYLRDELLKISESNTIFIATHSIYMVDRKNLSRHYKVEKSLSSTSVVPIPKDNPYMEEVIYESLGTSVYELIEPNMIVFEGKTDKDLFDAFTKKFKRELKPKKIGTISADGVEKMPKYTKFFNGKMVKGYFITDSDKKGKEYKKIMINSNENLLKTKVFEINDLLNQKKEATLEDLLPTGVIEACIRDLFSISFTINKEEPYMSQIEKKNKELKGKINTDLLKGKITRCVLKDVSNLTKKDCGDKYKLYCEFLKNVHSRIK